MGGSSDAEIPETEAEKAQAEVAMKRWKDYQQLFQPFEQKFFNQVDQLNSPGKMQLAMNTGMNPLAKAFASQAMQVQRQQNAGGINPNSGKGMAARNAHARGLASAKVDAGARATNAQADNYVTGLQNIVALGHGQVGNAMQGMTDIASAAQTNAYNQTRLDQADSQMWGGVAGAAIGGGLRWGMQQNMPEGK